MLVQYFNKDIFNCADSILLGPLLIYS